MKYRYPSRVGDSISLHRSLKTLPSTSDDLSSVMRGITLRVCFPFRQAKQLPLPPPSTSIPVTTPFLAIIWMVSSEICPRRCRRDNGSVCDPPIYASFGPQNIIVITSQESHYWNVFLIRFTKTHFLHPPNYSYWDVSYIVGKVWMRRLQRRWNRRKRFSNDGVILRTSVSNVDLRVGIDSRSLSRPLVGLNCDVWLPEMLP